MIPERTGIPTFAFILFFSLRYVTLLTLVSKTDQVFRLRAEPAAVAELLLNPFSDTGTDDSRFGRGPEQPQDAVLWFRVCFGGVVFVEV